MKNIVFLFLLTLSLNSIAQETPKVILKDSSQLKLSSLKVDVKIIGNFATTTYDMKFYNELDSTLEGELAFPLGEGQSVSNFAMDVNGKLREAVIVEKELARVAFENTIRQKIDPGLLVKTEGNNYKARVYPILPKKHKQIVITYEQELRTVNGFMIYELPLNISEKLAEFSISLNVEVGDVIPTFKNNPYKELYFNEKKGGFHAEITKSNHTPQKAIVLKIPNNSLKEKVLSYNDYFYAYKALKPNDRLKSKPNKITLFWDASYSLKNRNVAEELNLLDAYFKYLQHVEVEFISFSNTIITHKKIDIENGSWDELKQLIKNTVYDGGTNFNALSKLKLKTDETLLFTDGLDNLGRFLPNNKKAVYAINSLVSANHEELNNMTTKSGGAYINLVRLDSKEALKQLKNETFQFLGISDNNSVTNVYPNRNTNVTTDFSIAGRFSENTTIELLFGYRGKVTQKLTVPIQSGVQNSLVKRLWAKQKLSALNFNKEENKKEIIDLATQNHLITDYTSMLILDRLEDYVRYRIEPPQELKSEYKERIKNLKEDEAYKQLEIKERKADLVEDYKDIINWYNMKFPKKEKKVVKKEAPQIIDPVVNTPVLDTTSIVTPTITNNPATTPEETVIRNVGPNSKTISGTLVDETNMALPGATVVIKGTTSGASTDFDGKYSISANLGDVLTFSYVGYVEQETTVGAGNTIDIALELDDSLEEVVVTAFGIKRVNKALGYTVTTVSSDQLDVVRSLVGRAAGVQVTSSSGAVGASSSVTIRGAASTSNNKPLYIIDGIISESNPSEILSTDAIDSMHVLSPENGTALYGNSGSSGVVIVVTKEGKVKNEEAIKELNQQIADKIELKAWNPDTPYLKVLEKEKSVEAAYIKYLEIRSDYANVPAFYLDVADFFDKRKSSKIAIRVLTNLIEVDLNNHELTKALGYKLEYFKQYELAVIVYEKVLELRPEEPQSYRDLALAYEAVGAYQKSFDLLFKIYNGALLEKDVNELFYGIEAIAFVELSRLVNNHGKRLKLNKKQKNFFKPLPVDVRVVIDWNHKETDIDLWVIDPSGEKCLYSNSETKIGGRISEDFTDGYGPEEFMLKKAIKGKYKVLVDYYADSVQKISGPTILKVSMYTNYGKANEVKKTITVRLDKEEDDMEIGSLIF